jgi:hypothetical protein
MIETNKQSLEKNRTRATKCHGFLFDKNLSIFTVFDVIRCMYYVWFLYICCM